MVRNPVSGNRDDSERAKAIAQERGIEVRDSTEPGEIVPLAEGAVEQADQIIACGGDGTVNETVRGVDRADGLGEVELAVVPTGTGNNFAGNLGVVSVEAGFDVLTDGELRRLDLGVADGLPFVTSCMGGLIAEASEDTSDDLKERIGSLAYVLQTLLEAREYEGQHLDVIAGEADDPLWSGPAAMVLVGNARRFLGDGRGQANLEDGRLEVVVIESAPAIDFLADDAIDRLLNRDESHLLEFSTPRLEIETTGEPMEFSLDGEIVARDDLVASVREGAMRFRVGTGYDPSPPSWPGG